MGVRSDITRQQLLDAAVTVLSERGYARTTTKEIARAAGVSEGTIYRHFTSKQELFRAAFTERSVADVQAITGLPDLAGTGTVRGNLLLLIRMIEDVEANVAPLHAAASSDAELAAALFSESPLADGGNPIMTPLEPLARYLAAEQALGRVRGDIDVAHAAFALFAIPFAGVTTNRLARTAGKRNGVDMAGALEFVLRSVVPE
jgi:AcrR family transcriptional regulator